MGVEGIKSYHLLKSPRIEFTEPLSRLLGCFLGSLDLKWAFHMENAHGLSWLKNRNLLHKKNRIILVMNVQYVNVLNIKPL